MIWPDEVLFFSPAFELGINGIMRTNVLNGLIPGMDTHTLWMPPAYILLLAGVFQFFQQNYLPQDSLVLSLVLVLYFLFIESVCNTSSLLNALVWYYCC